MLDRFHKYNTEKSLFRKEDKILVAVSGGIDSIVLVHLLKEYGAHFAIAHCNFALRGEESDADEVFVEQLAEELEVTIHIKKFDTTAYAKKAGFSTQMAARDLRYEWFHTLMEEKEYNYLLTAHHQNDTVETVLLNLVRGTGIAGFHGILPKKNKTVRPLLFATKEELQAYATAKQLTWREDKSNQSTYYQRNFIRLEVIPLLQKLNPNFIETFQQSIHKIAGAETIFNHYIEGCRLECIQKHEAYDTLSYGILKEEAEPILILFELLKPYGFNYNQSIEIFESLEKESGKQFISSSHIVVKDRGNLIITLIDHSTYLDEIMLNETDTEIELPWNNSKIKISNAPEKEFLLTNSSAYLDKELLHFPLTIRLWKPGDVFQPLGMKGKKKVSDFLNDLKVPLNLKKSIPVLVSNNEIVWVIGLRINDRFKSQENKPGILFSIS